MFLHFIFVLASDIGSSLKEKIAPSETQQLRVGNLKKEDMIDTRNYTQLLQEGENTKPGFVKKHVKIKIPTAFLDFRHGSRTKDIDYMLTISNEEEKYLGYIRARVPGYNPEKPTNFMKIVDLSIQPKFQNMGYGLSTLSGFIEYTRKKGLEGIILEDANRINNVHVVGLYEKLGFVKTGEKSTEGRQIYVLNLKTTH